MCYPFLHRPISLNSAKFLKLREQHFRLSPFQIKESFADKKIITPTKNLPAVDQAGSERTEAGESALPAEESPQPGRAKRKL